MDGSAPAKTKPGAGKPKAKKNVGKVLVNRAKRSLQRPEPVSKEQWLAHKYMKSNLEKMKDADLTVPKGFAEKLDPEDAKKMRLALNRLSKSKIHLARLKGKKEAAYQIKNELKEDRRKRFGEKTTDDDKDGDKKKAKTEKKRRVRIHKDTTEHKMSCWSRQVFIGNLPKTAGEAEVAAVLSDFSKDIKSIRILMFKKGGKKAKRDPATKKVIPQSRGVAFVRLRTKDARKAILEKDLVLDGRPLRTCIAYVKKAHLNGAAAAVVRKEKKTEEKKAKHAMKYEELKKALKKRVAELEEKQDKTAEEQQKLRRLKARLASTKQRFEGKQFLGPANITERPARVGRNSRRARVRMARK